MSQLPISMPPITSYPFVADLLAVLWAHKSLTAPWIFERYIQLQVEVNNDPPILDFYDGGVRENDLLPFYSCPFIEWRRIDRVRNYPPISLFVDYVRYQIDHNTYVDTPLDQIYLRCSPVYSRDNFIHETFIYGYNDKLKTVNVADFYENRKYTFEVITYDELENSAKGLTNFINLYSFRDYEYELNIEHMKTYINDFLSCTDSFSKYVLSYERRNQGTVFGIAVFDCLVELINSEKTINRQAYHAIYDHMVMMKHRINYLHIVGHIDDESYTKLLQTVGFLIEEALILRNTVLKYNITLNRSLVERINKKCIHLKNEEREFFVLLLDSLT